jgi:hypothetical protein
MTVQVSPNTQNNQPAGNGNGRRKFVLATLSAATLAAFNLWPDGHAEAASEDSGTTTFMQVSKLVSPRATNAVTGAALYQALRHEQAEFDANLLMLAKQIDANPGITVESLAEVLEHNGMTGPRDTLNRIVSAWYLGVVGFKTYAYETALMFGVVSDVLSPPSYVRRAPLYWAESTELPSI